MGLKQYFDRASEGDDADLRDFCRRVFAGSPVDDDLTTAHDRWLYTHIVMPAMDESNRRTEMARRIAEAARDLPPIMKGTGAKAMAVAIARAKRVRGQ